MTLTEFKAKHSQADWDKFLEMLADLTKLNNECNFLQYENMHPVLELSDRLPKNRADLGDKDLFI